MTKDAGHPSDDQLDAYVDGTLGAEETGRFEARRADDDTLRAALETQKRIDESLARVHEPPPAALERVLKEIDRQAVATVTPAGHQVPIYRRPWAIAALIILSVGAAWQLISTLPRGEAPDDYGPKPLTTADAFYRQAVENGFKPDWVCKDDEEFSSTFRKRFRQPLLLAHDTGPVSTVGLSYLNWLSTHTTALLSRVDGQPVVVLIDRLRNDRTKSLPPESGLHLFRRVLGELVLYEVTPLPEPHVMGLFYNPDDGSKPTDK